MKQILSHLIPPYTATRSSTSLRRANVLVLILSLSTGLAGLEADYCLFDCTLIAAGCQTNQAHEAHLFQEPVQLI